MTEWVEFIAACLALFGAAFLVLAALALHRMPDIYGRLSATSKAVTLGAATLLVAAATYTMDGGVIARATAGVAFLLLTSPIAGHMLGRAAWRSGMEAQVYYQDGPQPGVLVSPAADAERDADEEAEAEDGPLPG